MRAPFIVKLKTCMHAWDTIVTDIYPAKVVGLKTVWVNRRAEKRPTEPERTPDYETSNLVSTLDLLHEKHFEPRA
jgi:FMN phosphatase YigB (HAD superfamily)